MPAPLSRIDPTRTITLRRAFETAMSRRFALLRKALVDLVLREDALGLRITRNERWAYQTSLQKLAAFRAWLQDQMKAAITSEDAWWEKYVEDGYRKGAKRALQDVMKERPEGLDKKLDWYKGTQREFMQSSFGRIVPVEKVKMLASRVFSDLDGITDFMETRIVRALTDGLTQGQHPNQIAAEMTKTVTIGLQRAKTLSRTEIIRSHAEGQLDALERLGVDRVGVTVEWSTAGDNHVCPMCKPLEGVVLTTKEARGILPRHPNAVFASSSFVPYGECEEIVRAWYHGPSVVFTTDGGKNGTTIGPNHPVMTRRGMVRAAELRKGDEVVYDTRRDCLDSSEILKVNYKKIPTVEQAFDSSFIVDPRSFITSASSDLHGDRVFCQGKVYGIVPARGLLLVRDSFGIEKFREGNFVRADTDLKSVSRFSSDDLGGHRVNRSTSSLVSVGNESETFFRSSLLHSSKHTLTASSRANSISYKSLVYSRPATAEMLRETFGTPSLGEQLQNFIDGKLNSVYRFATVHSVKLSTYEGWAYDATTHSSLYCSDGFVVSNCRCSFKPAGMIDRRGTQIKTKNAIDAAIDRSLGYERKRTKSGMARSGKLSSWVGAKLKVAKNRPRTLIG